MASFFFFFLVLPKKAPWICLCCSCALVVMTILMRYDFVKTHLRLFHQVTFKMFHNCCSCPNLNLLAD